MAGEEGVGVERKLHAGGVRDGLAKQDHDSGSSWGAQFTTKGTHVTCAVENLHPHRWENICEIAAHAQRKADLDRNKCINYITISYCAQGLSLINVLRCCTFHSADLMLTVRPLLVRVLFIRRKKLRSLGSSFISFLFKPVNDMTEAGLDPESA